MWTLNSAKTLHITLKSIKKAVPKDNMGQKIIIDGHSTDKTKQIAKKFGWNFIDAKTVGIPYQANQALELVDTDFFASFEHDVILNPNWFKTVMNHMQSDPKIGVVQGVRHSTNTILRKIEEASLKRVQRYTSIDNNLYRTEIIRNLGGYDTRFPISTDRNLQDRIWGAGYKWVIDKKLVSDHIRGSVRQTLKHNYEFGKFSDYPEIDQLRLLAPGVLFSPIRGLELAIKKSCPQLLAVYPYWKLMNIKNMFNQKSNLSAHARLLKSKNLKFCPSVNVRLVQTKFSQAS